MSTRISVRVRERYGAVLFKSFASDSRVLLHVHIYIQMDICKEIEDWVKFSTRWHCVPTMHVYTRTKRLQFINVNYMHSLISFSQRQRRWRWLQRYFVFWLCAIVVCWMKMHRNCIASPYQKKKNSRDAVLIYRSLQGMISRWSFKWKFKLSLEHRP